MDLVQSQIAASNPDYIGCNYPLAETTPLRHYYATILTLFVADIQTRDSDVRNMPAASRPISKMPKRRSPRL
jgi:hypothetical protein